MEKCIEIVIGGGFLITLIFFIAKAPLNVTRAFGIIVILLYILICLILFIFLFVSSVRDRGMDKYGILEPVETNMDYGYYAPTAGAIVYGVLFAILSLIFKQNTFGRAILEIPIFGAFGVVCSLVIFVITKITNAVSKNTYNRKLASMKRLEAEAHTACDPEILKFIDEKYLARREEIKSYCYNNAKLKKYRSFFDMNFFFDEALNSLSSLKKLVIKFPFYIIPEREKEAHAEIDLVIRNVVDKAGLADVRQIHEGCKNSSSGSKYNMFLSLELFIIDGLNSLVRQGNIGAKKVHTDKKGKVLTLYETKNTVKRAELTEEISLDDE